MWNLYIYSYNKWWWCKRNATEKKKRDVKEKESNLENERVTNGREREELWYEFCWGWSKRVKNERKKKRKNI
jgi:hypothetical protein